MKSSITPFLWFNNNAEAAMKFYTSIFKSAKVLGIRKRQGKVLYVHFRLNGQEFYGLNGGPHFKFTQAVSFMVSVKTQREVDYYWEKLSKGGRKSHCGWLTDKFGLSWQITPVALMELQQGKDAKRTERVFEAMLEMDKIDIAKIKAAAKSK